MKSETSFKKYKIIYKKVINIFGFIHLFLRVKFLCICVTW